MPMYAYRAVASSGRIVRGKMQATNENELAYYLTQSDLELIDAREKASGQGPFLAFRRRGISRRTLAAFCSQARDLLQAGIPLPEALRIIRESAVDPVLSNALAHVSRSITDGKGIAESFALFPALFPPVFIAIVGAGEQSGNMATVFGFLSTLTDSDVKTHERLARALRYPVFLFLTAGSAVAFMMAMVMPQIAQFLSGLGGKLPLASRAFIALSGGMSTYGPALLGLFLLVVIGVFAGRKTFTRVRLLTDGIALSLPVVGNAVSKAEIARFARSFAILFRSGCEPAECLLHAGKVMSNTQLREGVDHARRRLLEGAALSTALGTVFPGFALSMLRMGEQSGDLGKSLDNLASTYDSEASSAIDLFIGTLEPGLTLMIGAVLAWTVFASLAPLYGSLSVLGSRM
ncbi:MAG: type II secretion system F family protein [Alphaproteobacteria bacterium]|nr:type II secretion system F family protein [Alphaproteobacteria bacterium]